MPPDFWERGNRSVDAAGLGGLVLFLGFLAFHRFLILSAFEGGELGGRGVGVGLDADESAPPGRRSVSRA